MLSKKIWIALSALLIYNYPSYGFKNLSEAQSYAAVHNEYPQPDNQNLLSPDYATHYQKLIPSWIRSVGNFLGLVEKPVWTPVTFKESLATITLAREENGYHGRFVEKLTPTHEHRFIVLGDVHGAFHSLVRSMQELVRMGIMDQQFTIADKNTYIVFNGNVVNLSPYILETLSLVMALMHANPQQVIYIRGKHEDKEFWLNFGLRQELEMRAADISDEDIPLKSIINRFFATLPLAFYLVESKEKNINLVRIASQGRKDPELNEEEFGDFFIQTDRKPDIFNLANKTTSKLTIDIKAVIKADERGSTYTPTKGLLGLEPDQGSTTWTLLSSPTRTNRTLYEFFYDAFASIETKKTMAEWTIALYNRDVRDVQGFEKYVAYNLITGRELTKTAESSAAQPSADATQQELTQLKLQHAELEKKLALCAVQPQQSAAQKTESSASPESSKTSNTPATTTAQAVSAESTDNQEIIVGTSLDLSKYLKVESLATQVGLTLAFDRANKNGGVHGKKLKLIVLDDEYHPEKARKNIDILLKKYNTSIILSPMGSTPIQGFLDLVKEKKVLALFPSTGSVALRDKNIPYLIHFRPSYGAINAALLRYGKDQLKAKRFAIFYSQDLSSVGLADHITAAGITSDEHLLVGYDPTTRNFQQQADLIKSSGADAIVLFGTPRAAESLLSSIGVQNLVGKHILGTEQGDSAFKKFIAEHGLQNQFIDTQNIPNPETSDLEIMKEYRKDLDNAAKIDVFSAEGYLAASVFIDALQRINGPITNDSIVSIFEQTKHYTFKGLKLNFNPLSRELSQQIFLDTGKPEWIALDLPEPVEQKPASISPPETTPAKPIALSPTPAAVPQQELGTKNIVAPTTATEIVVGSTMDLSKAMKVVGEDTKLGLSKAFEKVNREGGVNGKRIRLIALDDEYNPTIARKNIEKLLSQYNVDIIISPVGATPIKGFFDLAREKKILILFPSTGAPTIIDTDLSHVIPFRSSYTDIDISIIRYAVENLQAKKFIIVAAQDESSFGIQNHVALAKIPESDYKVLFHEPHSTNFQKIIEEIKSFNPDAIGLFTTSRAATELIRQAGVQNLVGKYLLGSELGDELFKDFLKKQGLEHQFIDTQNLPNPVTSDIEIVKEYRKEMGRNSLNIFSLEGYISGMLFAEFARKVTGPITKEAVINVAQETKNSNFKGLPLNFDPITSQLYHTIWLDIGKKEWIPLTIDIKQYLPKKELK